MTWSGMVNGRGQITIPAEVRKRLGLHEGDKVEFVLEGSAATLRPARRNDNPFARFRGALAEKFPATMGEIVQEERVLRGR